MMFKPDDTDKDEDFFNAPAGVEKPKKVKVPPLMPDDPRYYDKDDEWEHIRPSGRSWKTWLWIIAIGVGLGLIYAGYVIWFTPYSEGAVQYGYVEKIDKRGHAFKTFEGVIIPYKAINDTIEPYSGDLVFSTTDPHVAAELRKLLLGNLPARVEYDTYRRIVPWRGSSKVVITKVDTADVTKIWPVTLQHPLIPGSDKRDR